MVHRDPHAHRVLVTGCSPPTWPTNNAAQAERFFKLVHPTTNGDRASLPVSCPKRRRFVRSVSALWTRSIPKRTLPSGGIRATLKSVTQLVRQRFTFPEYVQLDEDTGHKHEYLDGMVWAMAGGSPDHAAIAGNIVTLLNNALRGKRCRAFTSDLRVRVQATGLGTYPDVSVVCDGLDFDPEDPKRHTVINPRVLVEVLSPSTEEYDRGEKLEHYQKIPSLAEVMLVAHDRRYVEVWSKEADSWKRKEVDATALVTLESLGCQFALDEVYWDPLK